MKKRLLTTVFLAVCLSMLMAQLPQAFKYQAVVRDHNGTIIADQNINLRISILFGDPSGNTVYSETHPCNTNGMGLVNLEIGRGFNPTGSISDINWAEGSYFVKIEMDEYGGSDFKPMGVAQLLSVPYALHSGTAEGISGDGGDGVPANNWILFGNRNTDPTEDKLGTTDAADLVIVTDDIERMRVLSDGDVHIVNSANVGMNLTVEQNVNLNTFSGETNNYGPFTVANLSPTLLSGILTVDLHTDLNSSLNVDGVTDLNSAFNVNNASPSLLTGTLLVNGNAVFNQHVTLDNPDIDARSPSTGALVVAGGVGIGGNLYVRDSVFFDGPLAITNEAQSFDPWTGALTVTGGAGIGKRFNVAGATMIDSTLDVNGQLKITANPGSHKEDVYEDYPLLVEGGDQGIAIKVNGARDKTNNYISFWDAESGDMWGRIEGQTLADQAADPEYILEHGFKISGIILSTADLGIFILELVQAGIQLTGDATASTVCGGLGACVTVPPPTPIAASVINVVLKIAEGVVGVVNLGVSIADEVNFTAWSIANIGVSYQSGSGDYAEWLPKLNPSEIFAEGDLVGIKNGFVTKNTWGVEKIMIVSSNPIVLGNMPQNDDEINFVKVAFMGQVPAKVLGDIEPGDYILPNEFGSEFGRAVHPEDMRTSDYKKVAGVAWTVLSEITSGVSLVNVAVGINSNDLSDVLCKQEEEIKTLKAEMDQLNAVLSDLVVGYAEATGYDVNNGTGEPVKSGNLDAHNHDGHNLGYSTEDDILYFDISEEQIESAIEMARETYTNMLDNMDLTKSILLDEKTDSYLTAEGAIMMPIEEHPFWKRIDSDPQYKEDIIRYIKGSFESAMHTHKKYAHKFTDVKLHE